jgi:MFS family permease
VTAGYRWYALGLLAVINLLNYIDRNVIYALFEPIKRDLALTDAQLGWLGSAYILVFSVAALPFGVSSDLRSRRAVIAWGVTVWSAFTFLSGLVRSYGTLFTCRAAVGVGEAAYGPAASSLVADYFPGSRRAMAMGILASGVSLGGVSGLLLGGYLEGTYGWRVAFMTVGVPGFVCALLVARLIDPTRPPAKLTIRSFLRDFHIGATALLRQLWPLLASVVMGLGLAYWLDRSYGANSRLDVAAFSAAVGLGLAINILYWVWRTSADPSEEIPFAAGITSAFDDILRAGKTVLHTPTLVYVFLAGAMISFGTNGIVGWGPTFVARELQLTAGEGAALLGKWGLIAGVSGTLFGGLLADWLRRWWETGRVITIGLGLLSGGPLTVWLLTIRDPELFQVVFTVAFFCLSWYNGPITAVIFDVVPPRISATVAGAYLLFIHLAGDAIALPLVGMLSDQFGLDRAILLLPLVVIGGGVVILGATRTAGRDMTRVAGEGQELGV